MDYHKKYLKYKSKYLSKKMYGYNNVKTPENIKLISIYLSEKYKSLYNKIGETNINEFIKNYLNDDCIKNILYNKSYDPINELKTLWNEYTNIYDFMNNLGSLWYRQEKTCNFIYKLKSLWDSEYFTGYDIDKNKKFGIRLSHNYHKDIGVYPFVFYYRIQDKLYNILISYANDKIILKYSGYDKTFPFEDFVNEIIKFYDHIPFLEYIHKLNGMEELELQELFNQKVQNYKNIDRVLILTLQFIKKNNKYLLPGEGENLTMDEIYKKYEGSPGLSALVIANEYKERVKKGTEVKIILNNNPNKEAEINKLTSNSRFIIIGHCCLIENDEYKIYGVDEDNNKPMSPLDFLNILNRNEKLKFNTNEFIISVYACEAANDFCIHLSRLLYNNQILSLLKCRALPVTRLGVLEPKQAKKKYIEACQMPKIIYNGITLDYKLISGNDL